MLPFVKSIYKTIIKCVLSTMQWARARWICDPLPVCARYVFTPFPCAPVHPFTSNDRTNERASDREHRGREWERERGRQQEGDKEKAQKSNKNKLKNPLKKNWLCVPFVCFPNALFLFSVCLTSAAPKILNNAYTQFVWSYSVSWNRW